MKKKIIILMLMVISMFTITTNVNAKSLYRIENDLTVEDERIDGSVFFAGDDIFTNSDINGIALITGEKIKAEGEIDYGFLFANTVNINGIINNDLFSAGNTINVKKSASILRDSYLLANYIEIDEASFAGDVRLYATEVELSNVTIKGNLYISAMNISIDDNVIIEGKFSYNKDAIVEGLDDINASQITTYVNTKEEVSFVTKLQNTLYSIVSGFIVLVILFLIIPKVFKKIDNISNDKKVSDVITKMGLGFIALIFVPVFALIILCTIIGLPISLIIFALYALCIYLATLLTSYIVGNKIYTKGLKKNYNFYSASLIGLVLIKLLELVPLFSVLVGFLSLIYGLGIIINLCIKK